jgi:ABC-type multidrug transport system fused ATPase/permease subunit
MYDFKTTLLSISLFSFFILIFIKITKKKLNYWGKSKMFEEEKLLKETLEIFRGIKEIRIFGAASYFSEKILKRKYIISQIDKNQFTLQQLPRLFVEIFTIICLTITIVFLLSTNKSFQDIIIIIGLYTFIILRIMPSVPRLTNVLSDLNFYTQNVRNLITEFKSLEKINLRENLEVKNTFYNLIEMKNISFSYDDKLNKNKKIILKNISVKIPKGKKIGIFGASGSGKTTFINILLNLIEPTSGEIIIDGKKIDYTKNNIPLKIGFVPQDIFLLDDTFLNNVTFGEDEHSIDLNKFNKSIINSESEHFINISEIGIKNQIIGESGVKISGGQKQRIGIARALYKENDIIIFDEATNSLDDHTESKVFSQIKNLVPEKTIVVITHKYSLIENFDIIYKFDNGDVTIIKSY